MISSRFHGLIRLHFIVKQLGGAFFFWGLVWILHAGMYQERLDPSYYRGLYLLIPAAAILEMWMRQKRNRSLIGMTREQLLHVTQREILFAFTVVFGVLVMSKDEGISRFFLVNFIIQYSIWITWMNLVGHKLIQRRLFPSSSERKSINAANTVVVARRDDIERDTAARMASDLPGAVVIGYVPYGDPGPINDPNVSLLGEYENIAAICRKYRARLLLAIGLEEHPRLIHSLQGLCDSQGMRLIWGNDKQHLFGGNLDAHHSGSHILLTSWQEPLEDPVNRALKRFLDLCIAIPVTLFVLPITCLITKTLQCLYSPGPLLYRQQRTGRNGEIFPMLKFRTMHLNDVPAQQARHGDSRIFKGGNFLRKTSIDELPQVLNVLRNEMSIVGPRPHFVDHDEKFAHIVADYPVRQFAKPGITGLAQIKGCRGETDTDRKVRHRVKLDHFYLRRWSPLFDICIIIDTAVQIIIPPDSAR